MQDNQFLTVDEIADLSTKAMLPRGSKVPRTARGWKSYIKREGWDFKWGRLSHMREGNMVYHISLLPEQLRIALPPPKLDPIEFSKQREKRRKEARKIILNAIANHRTAHRLSQNAAVASFVKAVDYTCKAARKRSPVHIEIKEFDLPYTIIPTAKGWMNVKGPWRVSRRTIYDWMAASRKGECINDPTHIRKVKHVEESGFELSHVERHVMKARAVLSDTYDVTFDMIVRDNEKRILETLQRFGYRIEYDGK